MRVISLQAGKERYTLSKNRTPRHFCRGEQWSEPPEA